MAKIQTEVRNAEVEILDTIPSGTNILITTDEKIKTTIQEELKQLDTEIAVKLSNTDDPNNVLGINQVGYYFHTS